MLVATGLAEGAEGTWAKTGAATRTTTANAYRILSFMGRLLEAALGAAGWLVDVPLFYPIE
jgi:hypothetical protein